jgi:hypothetical protein
MSSLVINIGVSSANMPGGGQTTAGAYQWLASPEAAHHGALLAVSQLIGAYDDNEPAQEVADAFGADFMAVPEYLSIRDTFTIAFDSANRLVRSEPGRKNAVAVAALLVQGAYWHACHAGNNRIWLFRDSRLQQLTSDHTVPRMASTPVVTRACGLEARIQPDYRSGTLEVGDVLVITSESVHTRLEGTAFITSLMNDHRATNMADKIVKQAIAKGAPCGTAAVVYVDRLPDTVEPPEYSHVPPVKALPEAGEMIDNFHIVKRRRKGRMGHYYSAVDIVGDLPVTLKFPDPDFMRDPRLRLDFLRDEWLSRRLRQDSIAQSLPVERGRRSSLYAVYQTIEGENIAYRLRRKERLSIKECTLIARQLATFLVEIHGKHIYHGDIRPENMILSKATRSIQFLGLDSHRIQYWLEQGEEAGLRVLSPIYTAPELWRSQRLDERSDLFAMGITIYHLLTGRFPFGHVKSVADMMERKFRPVEKFRDDVPAPLAEVLLRSCVAHAERRIASADEVLDLLNATETV